MINSALYRQPQLLDSVLHRHKKLQALDDFLKGPAKGLARINEAEQFLGLSRATLYGLMERGEMPYVKLGKSRRIPWNALEELVRQNTVCQ